MRYAITRSDPKVVAAIHALKEKVTEQSNLDDKTKSDITTMVDTLLDIIFRYSEQKHLPIEAELGWLTAGKVAFGEGIPNEGELTLHIGETFIPFRWLFANGRLYLRNFSIPLSLP